MYAETIGWLTLVTCVCIGVIHEALHIFSAQHHGYTTSLTPRFFKKIIPYALAVDLEKSGMPLTGRWTSWDQATQNEYNDIAIAPYVFIFPFCVFLLLTAHPVLMMWSTGILLWHSINYPLEWLIT